jgi:hypothetical protein
MRNVSGKRFRENQNTHFVFSDFFVLENRAVDEKMWKNMVERGEATDDNSAYAHCMVDT